MKSLDLNGIILLSQVLNFDTGPDQPQFNPGVDLPYALALPTYAATAWYHRKLPNRPAELEPLLREVENFALTDYLQALAAGSNLSAERKAEIAARLHGYTGLPADYIERANLRVNGGEFEKTLLGSDITTGRLDTRFAGPTIDPMSKEGRLRSAVGGDFLGLRLGVQRLRAHHAQIRRAQDLQGGNVRYRQGVGHAAPAAGFIGQGGGSRERHARPRRRHEAEPRISRCR